MDERQLYDEKEERKAHELVCPHCREKGQYEIAWLVRTKKRTLPGGADDRARAMYAKARSYMVRKDDKMACKNMRCHKTFEIAGVQSVAFVE